MALILNIETATEISSVCIAKGDKVLAIRESTEAMTHARETTILIEDCLKEANIALTEVDAIAVSIGPGSYTALRVGSSISKGICYALDIPLIGVSTLKSLAFASAKQMKGDYYCPMIDARRKEVYTATYNNAFTIIKEDNATVLTPDYIDESGWQGKVVCSGNGAPKFREMVKEDKYLFPAINCSAEHIAPLAYIAYQQGKFEDLAYFEPVYLKPPNITKSNKKLLA